MIINKMKEVILMPIPKKESYDFGGYATRSNVRCSDGRIIMHGAFDSDDGKKVPLVWSHAHADIDNIIGHALLERRDDGMYAYAKFNNTENGLKAKELVSNGDITNLSIFANELSENARGCVAHGAIREVSLVYAGANPMAFIDNVLVHGEEDDSAAIIYFGADCKIQNDAALSHSADSDDKNDKKKESPNVFNGSKTAADVIESMTDEQKAVCFGLAQEMLDLNKKDEDDDKKGEKDMPAPKGNIVHNAFEGTYSGADVGNNYLSHEDQLAIINDAKKYGSMKTSCLEHGITNVEYLFPEAKADSPTPIWYSRRMEWVDIVLNGVSRSPFSRIKSQFADITADEARAKGYTKGKRKVEEVFSLLKRTTGPTTIYKKQKMDRDDVIDITEFDVINWIKSEMRVMLDEEVARAALFGDGRLGSSDDKIDEQCIRPVITDDDFYTIKTKYTVAAGDDYKKKADKIVEALTIARREYKGSGDPIAFVNEDLITIMTLAQDLNGRYIYESPETIARKLRVNKLVPVPVMEGLVGKNNGQIQALMLNLRDYRVGADRGGAVNMFDDFDIDYNQQKYLIETRCSGALTVPKSAIVLEEVTE